MGQCLNPLAIREDPPVRATAKVFWCLLRPVCRLATLSFLVALLPACTHLPDYARPKIIQSDGPQTSRNSFTYRDLTIEDFQADSLPEPMVEHSGKINAHAAVQIRLTADSSFSMIPGHLYGQAYFFGTIERIGFEAFMLPERSWLNPGIPSGLRTYVLQHEQIHFALTEIAARRLTKESREWAPKVLVVKPTPQEVRSELARQIQDKINAAMEESLKRQSKFDEDASLFYNPRRQQWWYWAIEDELGTSSPPIHGRPESQR